MFSLWKDSNPKRAERISTGRLRERAKLLVGKLRSPIEDAEAREESRGVNMAVYDNHKGISYFSFLKISHLRSAANTIWP